MILVLGEFAPPPHDDEVGHAVIRVGMPRAGKAPIEEFGRRPQLLALPGVCV